MSQVHVSNHPLVKHKLTRLRDENTNPKQFRELVREIAICSPTRRRPTWPGTDLRDHAHGQADGHSLREQIGLVPILRAGLGMVEGIWEMMPSAEVWHIGLYRDEDTLQPVEYYNKLPVSTGPSLPGLDPMLATGGSAVATVGFSRRGGPAGSNS